MQFSVYLLPQTMCWNLEELFSDQNMMYIGLLLPGYTLGVLKVCLHADPKEEWDDNRSSITGEMGTYIDLSWEDNSIRNG